MPNFGENFCMNHAIFNDKLKLPWFNRDDEHCVCVHTKDDSKCCWCGKILIFDPEKPHGPFKRKRA